MTFQAFRFDPVELPPKAGQRRYRHLPAANARYVNCGERGGICLHGRPRFQYHTRIVVWQIDGEDLALSECIVQRIVDLGDVESKSRGGCSVDRYVGLDTVVLLVAVDLRELRYCLHLCKNLRCPVK